MTTIERLEKALAFAKELNLNDNQTKELFSLILEPAFKITWTPTQPTMVPFTVPSVPAQPWNTPQWPFDPNNPTIICSNNVGHASGGFSC